MSMSFPDSYILLCLGMEDSIVMSVLELGAIGF
jgi:hypothetical protein